MKRLFFTLLFLGLAVQARASVLSDAINNCAIRTWCEITTSVNLTPTWAADGGSGFLMGYATELKWDSHGRKLHFVGMDHANDIGDMPTTHAQYAESNNTWTRVVGTNFHTSTTDTGASHQYDHNAIDVTRRILFHRYQYVQGQFWQRNLDIGTSTSWAAIANNPTINGICCGGTEWVEFLGGLIHISGSGSGTTSNSGRLMKWTPGTNTWSTLADNLVVGNLEIDQFLECSEFRKHCIFGGGDDGGAPGSGIVKKIWKIDSAGTVTQLTDAPINIGVHHGSVSVVDPVSGKYLFLTKDAQQFWEFDVENGANGTWTQMTGGAIPPTTMWNNTPIPLNISGVVGGAIDTYGATAWVACQQGANPCRFYVYKHTAAQSYATKCAQPGVVRCVNFDNQTMLKYAWNAADLPACNAELGTPFNWGPTDRSSGGNSLTRQIDGTCHKATIDNTVFHSGTGSLKIPNPNGMRQDPITWDEPFSGTTAPYAYFAPGSPNGNVVYIQFYAMFDTNHLYNPYSCRDQGGTGPPITCAMKFAQLYGVPGSIESTTCCRTGVAITNWRQTRLLSLYGGDNQPHGNPEPQPIRGCTWPVYDPTLTSNSSLYPEPPCVKVNQNVFHEFTIRVEVGHANGCLANSRVTTWLNGLMVTDYPNVPLCIDSTEVGAAKGIGSMDFTAQLTGKDPLQTLPDSNAWYDSLIISTNPIQMANGIPAATGDTTSPVVTITAPTSSATYATGTATINIAGTCTDDTACTGVNWSNDRGGAGPATAGWSQNNIALQAGVNVLTVSGMDAAGNTPGTDTLTVTYTPTGGLPAPVTIRLGSDMKIGDGVVKMGEAQQ